MTLDSMYLAFHRETAPQFRAHRMGGGYTAFLGAQEVSTFVCHGNQAADAGAGHVLLTLLARRLNNPPLCSNAGLGVPDMAWALLAGASQPQPLIGGIKAGASGVIVDRTCCTTSVRRGIAKSPDRRNEFRDATVIDIVHDPVSRRNHDGSGALVGK